MLDKIRNNRILQVLAIRQFSYLLIAEFFSQVAMNIFNFALLIVVFAVANSSTAVSGVVIAFTLPSLFFGVLAGVYVDRWNKKSVLIATNLIRGLTVLPLIFLYHNLVIVYLATFFVSLVTQFFIPAETPIIPLLVKKKFLLSANALFGMGIYASIFIAYAISGPLLIFFGKSNLFVLLAVFFLIAGFFASLIRIKKYDELLKVRKEKEVLDFSLIREARNAISLVSKTKVLYQAILSLALVQILILILAVVGPGYAQDVLKIKIENFPIFFVTPAIIGLALGAFILGSFFHNYSRQNLNKFGLFLMGISIILLPYGSKIESRAFIQMVNSLLPQFLQINILHIMVVLAFFIGFATAFIFVPANTILQEETSDEFRGKVWGVLNFFIGLFSLIPVLAVGGLADVFGVKNVITVVGAIVILLAIFRIVVFDKKRR